MSIPRSTKVAILIGIKYLHRHIKYVFLSVLIFSVLAFTIVKIIPNLNISTTLSEGIVGTYQEYDLPEVATKLLSQPLVDFDQNGRFIPKLVNGWEVNHDSTLFEFKLKDDLMWVDGSKINSQDIEFSIPDVEISYPDEKTIRFALKESFSPLPSLLTKPVFKKGTLIGIGPYKIDRIEKSRIFITKITLKPVGNFDLPNLILRFYPNEKIATTAFYIGEVQSLLGLSDLNQFKDNPKASSTLKVNFSRVVSILYNTKDPILSNRSLRQALSYSAPKILDEEIARTPIQPYSWAYTDDVNKYLSNPDKAQAALKRAESASEDLLKKEIILTATPQYEGVGKEVMVAWNALGLNAVLRVESGIPQNFQALLIAQSIPQDPDQYSLWHSTQGKTNITNYSSARVDKDLEDGRKLAEEKDRQQKYFDFQRILLEDSPATFLYFPKYSVVFLKKAENHLNKVLPLQLPR